MREEKLYVFQTAVLLVHLNLSICLGVTRIQCKGSSDCSANEYCEQQRRQYFQTCQCATGYVRVNSNCLPRRDQGEPCDVDTQCSHLGYICHLSKCRCPKGQKKVNGSCMDLKYDPSAPTPPAHLQEFWNGAKNAKRLPKRTQRPDDENYTGAIAICALIFVSFSVLIVVTSYNFRMRNRRLEEVRAILDAHATNVASTPHARRASLGSIRDAPPSYNTLSPPSYEQATGQALTSFTRTASPLRNQSYSLSIETAPMLASNPAPNSESVRCNISNNESSSLEDQGPQRGNEDDAVAKDRY